VRIAIINHHRNLVGGVESYLSQLLPAMQDYGFQVAFWSVEQADPARPQISIPDGMPAWSVAELGEAAALATLNRWQPDVIFAHGLRSPGLEIKTQQIAPAVFFAHAYYGACISGAKTFRRPEIRVCEKRFGWQCLLHFYPRRCGGLNPIATIKQSQNQMDRLALLSNYRAIVVASRYMGDEYRKYNLPHPVKVVGLPITANDQSGAAAKVCDVKHEWRLLFIGRMDELKGGQVFLESLPMAQRELGRTLHVTFAGDGPSREAWQQRANQLSDNNPDLKFDFTGWVGTQQRNRLFQTTDLLVVPSLWPEPFGLVGLEAGQFGVPAAAFDVGGISDWLADGVSGALTVPEPPLEQNLAKAIVRCLKDEQAYQRLSQSALEQAGRFSMSAHLENLLPVLEMAADGAAGKARINQEVIQYQ